MGHEEGAARWGRDRQKVRRGEVPSSDYLDRVLGGLSLLARCASKSICLRALS